jgi:Trypsin-like peptidase domain
MISRRFIFLISLIATAVSFFTLGIVHQRRTEALDARAYDAKFEAFRAEVRGELDRPQRTEAVVPAGAPRVRPETKGADPAPAADARQRMISEIKQELQSEMGLLPVHLLRDRRSSFVELYSTDNFGKTNYGTAGYLGKGYFVTVKHAVVALKEDEERANARKITSVTVMYRGKEIPARVVDTGDADVEVHSGDWAIIKTKEVDLPPLHVDTNFAYDFAEPIFRLGNDYSKGIILSTGYVGQRTAAGLITCLTDGHPGVSGGGVLNQRGDLVGIPIGRMQGDYRFSFILPLRAEMLRRLPAYEVPVSQPTLVAAAEQQ